MPYSIVTFNLTKLPIPTHFGSLKTSHCECHTPCAILKEESEEEVEKEERKEEEKEKEKKKNLKENEERTRRKRKGKENPDILSLEKPFNRSP